MIAEINDANIYGTINANSTWGSISFIIVSKPLADAKIEPKDYETSPIKGGSKLQVECKPGLWLNTKTNKAGMFLAISKIVIDGGSIPKKSRKNRK